jgi:hypothetical protein
MWFEKDSVHVSQINYVQRQLADFSSNFTPEINYNKNKDYNINIVSD